MNLIIVNFFIFVCFVLVEDIWFFCVDEGMKLIGLGVDDKGINNLYCY